MSDTNLFNGTGPSSVFLASWELPPLPPGECLTNAEDLREWIAKGDITIQSTNGALFGYTAGPPSAATPDDTDKPRVLYDEQGRYLGLAVFQPDIQEWSLEGVPGEIKTVQRTDSTVEKDLKSKSLNGWFICDGNDGTPDLTGNDAFFSGTGPDWDRYSCMKIS